MKRGLNVTIKLIIIALFVVAISSYVHIIENKTYSDNINKAINLSTMALKADEFKESDIYSAKDTFTGDLTGYVYNCPLCSGELACMWRYDIKDGKTTYDDATYGRVRIVASSSNLPCGSIIRFETKRISDKPVIAIVLDRGVRGNAIDLLSESNDYAYNIVERSVITYDVLRIGWGKTS